jgi:hypothetical protein
MPTIAPSAPSLRLPPSARLAALAAATLGLLGLAAAGGAAEADKPDIMLMTGLPIVWGEAGPFDPGSRPALAYRALQEEFDVALVDTIAADAPAGILLLAQPQRLAPEELVALDAWVRGGGRALIFADPVLAWPSGLPLGDIRRPPPAHLLGPLLTHWGLTLEAPAAAKRREETVGPLRLAMEAPGRFAAAPSSCRIRPEWLARCRIEAGRAILIADADLFRDDLWSPEGRRTADNPLLIAGWLDELAGVRRERRLAPAAAEAPVAWIVAATAALLVAAGIALHMIRRRG